jgi:hypothetical protein
MKIKRVRPVFWLFESLEKDPQFEQRRLFSLDAAYIGDTLYLAYGNGPKEAWNGLMICTSPEHHASLRREFPQLQPHQALKKWLHLPQSDPEFESVGEKLVGLVQKRDPRLGIVGKSRKAEEWPKPRK